MKKFILGIIVGAALLVVFIYVGGGTALKVVGKKAIEIGEKVEMYEKVLKDTTQGLLDKKTDKQTNKDKGPATH
ncbi:MAG: hypothetical protein A2Z19_03330 [Deltaproteobacteria bacterium RBG_16_54_18]|nr:MAG: hypothetical protein A2Z19_03330 [Deltaproteobacteria bacterium RBG_16_54_18]